MTTVAVLALQGAFIEHERRLREIGCETFQIRQKADLERPFDGLVLPGGESTVQARLLHELGLFEPLRDRIVSGLPVLGTCAGLILLAADVQNVSDGRGCSLPAGNADSADDGKAGSAECGKADSAEREKADPDACRNNDVCKTAVVDADSYKNTDAGVYCAGFRSLPVTVIRNGYGRQLGSFHVSAMLSCEGDPIGEIPMTFIRAPRIAQAGEGVECLASIGDEPVAVRCGNQIGCAFHPELDMDSKIYELFLNRV